MAIDDLPTLLEAADDVANEATLDTVGLDSDEAVGRISTGSHWTANA